MKKWKLVTNTTMEMVDVNIAFARSLMELHVLRGYLDVYLIIGIFIKICIISSMSITLYVVWILLLHAIDNFKQ